MHAFVVRDNRTTNVIAHILRIQVAGVSFAFNPNRPPGERIVRGSVRVQNQPIIDVKLYRLCTKGYLASGKDGYDSLIGARVIVNEDDGPVVSTIVQNHFKSVKILLGERKAKYSHRPSIRSLNRSKSVEPPSFIRNATDDCVPEEDDENDCDAFRDGTLKERIAQLSMSPNARRLHRRRTMSYGLNSMRRQFSLQESIDYNDIRSSLVPTVDDRIRVVVE